MSDSKVDKRNFASAIQLWFDVDTNPNTTEGQEKLLGLLLGLPDDYLDKYMHEVVQLYKEQRRLS